MELDPIRRTHLGRGMRAALCSSFVVLAEAAGPARAQADAIERVSVDSSGAEGPFESRHLSLSGDGRYVAFDSYSSLVPGQLGVSFVYVRDRASGTTEFASVSSGGGSASNLHMSPRISDDGRWVVFLSTAADLGPVDTNGMPDVYLCDRVGGTTELVSVSSAGVQSNGPSYYPNVSGDGRFVVFVSGGSNLVPGDVEGMADVFVRDRATGITERVSVSPTGVGGNSQSGSVGNRVEQVVSDDGRWVAFVSWASNLVPGDANGSADVFLRDRQAGVTLCVSATAAGLPGDLQSWGPRLSPDGRFVAFSSWATNLTPGDSNGAVDVFLQDRLLGTLERVSVDSSGAQLYASSSECAVSADGRFVTFVSFATSLAPGADGQTAHLFVRDLRLGTTRIASQGVEGAFEDGVSFSPEISADGTTLAFRSSSTNLVTLDGNQVDDVFAHDLRLTPALVYCTGKPSSQGCTAAISGSGVPSASSGQPFLIRAEDVVSGSMGLLLHASFWQYVPFQGGFLCLAGPISRSRVQSSGGSAPCTGSFVLDFNASSSSTQGPGAEIAAQWWFRDPADPFHSGLSDALLFYVQP